MPKTIDELETRIKELETENKKLLKPFDTKDLTDSDFDKIFSDERLWKNTRFKELNDRAKKGDDLVKANEEAEVKKLEADKKFQELLEIEKKKNEELANKIKQTTVDNVIKTEAQKLGAINPDTVSRLIDRSKLVLDADGNPTNVGEVLKGLSESDKYLFGTPQLGTGTNPTNNNSAPRFKLSQIQDAKFYQENQAEIDSAIKNGQVENDLK